MAVQVAWALGCNSHGERRSEEASSYARASPLVRQCDVSMALESAHISYNHIRTMAWSYAPIWRAASYAALFYTSGG